MIQYSKKFILLVLLILNSGCLLTRNEAKEVEHEKVLQEKVTQFQMENATVTQRVEQLESEVRFLQGKVDNIESDDRENEKNKDLKSGTEKNHQNILVLQQELSEVKSQMTVIQQELADLKKILSNGKNKNKNLNVDISANENPKSFIEAEEYFKNNEWKKAILGYEKYRESQPKGNKFDEATYKIGISFMELKMKDEAKVFFEEVIQKFPKSSFAKKAKQRINKDSLDSK